MIRIKGERQFDLRNEVMPDYSFFLVNRQAKIIEMESFEKLFSKVQADQGMSDSLKLGVVSQESFFLYYVVPIATRILMLEDEYKVWEGARSFVLGQLDQYLTKDTYTARVGAALRNFHSDVVDVELTDGIFLRSIDDATLESHINAIGRVSGLKTVMQLKGSTFQFQAATEQPRTTMRPIAIVSQFQFKSEDLLKAVRLLKSGAVGYFYTSGEVLDPMSFAGIWISGPDTNMLYGAEYHFRGSDIPAVQEMLSGLKSLASDNRFSLALSRFMDSYRKPIAGDRLVDYWIALESLLLPGEKEGELRFRAALRGAWFISKNSDQRTKIFDDLKKSYDSRSAVVHGTEKSIPEGIVLQTEDYLRHVLRRCIELGSTPTSELLNSLVMG